MDFGETKTLGIYSNKQKILLVGEGDFSFSLSLARAFGSATNITATSLDTRDELRLKYSNGIANVGELGRYGCTVVHGVNVHSMASDYRLDRYDIIVFNFPHSGLGFGHCEHYVDHIRSHQEVVRGFFRNAKDMLKDWFGEIHVTHKTTKPFNKWEIETLAKENGLSLIEQVDFNYYAFPAYITRKGGGPNCESSFPVGSASTFMFKKN